MNKQDIKKSNIKEKIKAANNRVAKKKAKKNEISLNVATLIIAAILLYVIINIFIAARKKPITTYKVNKSNVNSDIFLEGFILREETVLHANSNGYLSFYKREGDKTKKYSTICTIDQSGQISDYIDNNPDVSNLLSKEDYLDIRDTITFYKRKYTDNQYYDIYNFKDTINIKAEELTNEIIIKELYKNGNSIAVSNITAPESGIVTFYTDGFEDFMDTSISKDIFNKSNYKKNIYKSGDKVNAGDTILKIIPSEVWYIIAPISAEQKSYIINDEFINIRLGNENNSFYTTYEIINGLDGEYIKIKINKFMSNYISERYINVDIIIEEDSGLKVPSSAIVDKTVYMIPCDLLSAGGNQNEFNKVNIVETKEDGTTTIKQKTVTIYKVIDGIAFINMDVFGDGDLILNINNNEKVYAASIPTTVIQGVYRTTRGVAEFRMVTIKRQANEFVLVKSGEYLNAYDNVILDASKVKENQILY